MPAVLFRDVGSISFKGDDLKCPNSATITWGSDVLRGRCGSALSDRYQGLTNLTVEAVVETNNPFVDIHPGDEGKLIVGIPSATLAVPTPDKTFEIEKAILTTHAGRVEKDSLATGTYTFRAVSPDGKKAGASLTGGGVLDDSGAPGDFIRDISDFTFSGDESAGSDAITLTSDNFCPLTFEFSENSELLENFCQGDLFATYVGVTGLNLTATVTGRGILPAFEGRDKPLGTKGEVTFSSLAGSDASCTDLTPAGSVTMKNMNINEMSVTARHGEMAEVSISWTGHGDDSDEAIAIF